MCDLRVHCAEHYKLCSDTGGVAGGLEGGHAGLAHPIHGAGGGRLHQLRRAAAHVGGGRLLRPRIGAPLPLQEAVSQADPG